MTTHEFTDIKNYFNDDPTMVERWYDSVKQIDVKITKKDWFVQELITGRGEVMECRYHNDINQTIPYKDNWCYLNQIGHDNPLLLTNEFPHTHIFYDRIGINNGTNLSENVGIGQSTPSSKLETYKNWGKNSNDYVYTANEMRELSGRGVYTEQSRTKKEKGYTDYDYVEMGSFRNKHWIEELWAKLVAVK